MEKFKTFGYLQNSPGSYSKVCKAHWQKERYKTDKPQWHSFCVVPLEKILMIMMKIMVFTNIDLVLLKVSTSRKIYF